MTMQDYASQVGTSQELPGGMLALGYAGLLPFVALVIGLFFIHDLALQTLLAKGLLAYGAAILSFLGAVHWGWILARKGEGNDSAGALAVGILPASSAALSLILSISYGLGLQIISFAAFWLYERRVAAQWLPESYLALRMRLTLIVLGSLVLALMGPLASP